MYKRNGTMIIDPFFEAIIDDFNKRQQETMRLLLELIKEQTKKKKNRRKMKKHGQKNIIS
jgi:hypothetical protein